jgi:hypothetical protein
MVRFECPYFQGQVELSDEKRRHIVKTHPELLPEHLDLIALTLAYPDRIRRSVRFSSGYLLAAGATICLEASMLLWS